VPRQRLLIKIKVNGVQGKLLRFFGSNNAKSDFCDVVGGVPQGASPFPKSMTCLTSFTHHHYCLLMILRSFVELQVTKITFNSSKIFLLLKK